MFWSVPGQRKGRDKSGQGKTKQQRVRTYAFLCERRESEGCREEAGPMLPWREEAIHQWNSGALGLWLSGAELVCSDLVSQGAELGEFHPALMCLYKLGEQAVRWAEPGCL